MAELYGVETKALNRQVARNEVRLTLEEHASLRCQNGTSRESSGGRRYLPLVSTEGELAMLSSVLTSDRAAQVILAIIRTLIKLRSFLAIENASSDKVDELGQGTYRLFKIVFERLDSLEEIVIPKLKT